ncbi:MAG: guanylate kinase [Bacteroidota bacterium]
METGKIIIITAPSGAGKTSITRYLLEQFPQLSFSISAATRECRFNEVHGKDYYFLSEEQFQEKIANNEFVEWEMVYEGKYYGTLKSELERLWKDGKIPVLDIDVKGAIHVQKQFPGNCLSLFIQAPNVDELRKRLESRGTETAGSLATRLSKASYEMSFKESFNAIIVNDVLENAQQKAAALVSTFVAT